MSRRVRYLAAVESGRFAPDGRYACVTTNAATTERLAMRHARAVLEVQRAAKAYESTARRCNDVTGRVTAALARVRRAVERLRAVEKEVTRG